MGEINSSNVLVEKQNGRDYSEGLSVDWRIILKWVLGK
jgi:hypothetical protein